MVGLSFWMNDSNVVAPIRSPAAAKSVLGFSERNRSTAPAYLAAPGMSVPDRSRPWKSLVPMIWMSTGSAAWAAGALIRVADVATSASPEVATRARTPLRAREVGGTVETFRRYGFRSANLTPRGRHQA